MDVGHELARSLGPGGRHGLAQQLATDALALHGIRHLDCNLDRVRVQRVADPSGESDRLPVELGHQHLVLPWRHRRKATGHRVGETRHTRLEAQPDRGQRQLGEDRMHGVGVTGAEPSNGQLGETRGKGDGVRRHAVESRPFPGRGPVVHLSRAGNCRATVPSPRQGHKGLAIRSWNSRRTRIWRLRLLIADARADSWPHSLG